MFALDTLANFFGQGERVCRFGLFAFGDDEIRMLIRNGRTAAPSSFQTEIVDHFARADRTRRRVLEETSSRARAVRLRCHALVLCFFHARANLLGVVSVQRERSAQQ